jgi:hypothetical protein
MRTKWTYCLLTTLPLLLTSCFHAGGRHPQGYCQQLRTQLNLRSHSLRRVNQNPADRAVLLQQYQALGCNGS